MLTLNPNLNKMKKKNHLKNFSLATLDKILGVSFFLFTLNLSIIIKLENK